MRKKMNSEVKGKLTIDGEEFNLKDLSEKAQMLTQMLDDTQQKIAHLTRELLKEQYVERGLIFDLKDETKTK